MYSKITTDLSSASSPWTNCRQGDRSKTLCVQTTNIKEFESALAALYAEAFQGPPWFEEWSLQNAAATLQDYARRNSVFIISLDDTGTPLGMGIAYAQENARGAKQWYVAELCTSINARNRGVCSDILQALVQAGAESSCMCATSRTRTDNTPMIKIFERMGFVETHRDQAETGGKLSERVWFSRSFMV